MYNPNTTFNHPDFNVFLDELVSLVDKIRDIPKNILLFETRKYDINLKRNILQFKSTSDDDVYRSHNEAEYYRFFVKPPFPFQESEEPKTTDWLTANLCCLF
ncbi:hypothetical protein Zmor_018532 [Zophobas morio]|uniref:Uncharacterized protein n=1 Tax=Zophobas morio TaxID=2755281 RepID=A0AA38MD53_9CUCU|nr:hypothetical protein Zmor_018532 [Zophobas morio]